MLNILIPRRSPVQLHLQQFNLCTSLDDHRRPIFSIYTIGHLSTSLTDPIQILPRFAQALIYAGKLVFRSSQSLTVVV